MDPLDMGHNVGKATLGIIFTISEKKTNQSIPPSVIILGPKKYEKFAPGSRQVNIFPLSHWMLIDHV